MPWDSGSPMSLEGTSPVLFQTPSRDFQALACFFRPSLIWSSVLEGTWRGRPGDAARPGDGGGAEGPTGVSSRRSGPRVFPRVAAFDLGAATRARLPAKGECVNWDPGEPVPVGPRRVIKNLSLGWLPFLYVGEFRRRGWGKL